MSEPREEFSMNPFRWLYLFIAGQSKWSPCWLGFHRWDCPGGCCEKCGICDRFFGGHEGCGKTCRDWRPA